MVFAAKFDDGYWYFYGAEHVFGNVWRCNLKYKEDFEPVPWVGY